MATKKLCVKTCRQQAAGQRIRAKRCGHNTIVDIIEKGNMPPKGGGGKFSSVSMVSCVVVFLFVGCFLSLYFRWSAWMEDKNERRMLNKHYK